MLYVKLRGRVAPFHRIIDLGLTLAYGEEISLPQSRLNFSTDLSTALRLKQVERVSVFRVETAPPPPVSPSAPPLPPSKIAKPHLPHPSKGSLGPKDMVRPLGLEHTAPSESLQVQNMREAFQATLEDMAAKQEMFMTQMQALMESQSLRNPAAPDNFEVASLPPRPAVVQEEEIEEDPFADEMFIPQVSTSHLKSSTASAVVREEVSSSNIDAAAKLLRQRKKGSKSKP